MTVDMKPLRNELIDALLADYKKPGDTHWWLYRIRP